MSPDSISQLSLGTGAFLIFAACAAFVLMRGVTRLIIGTVILGISGWIAFRVWQEAPTLSVEWFGKSIAWFENSLPVAVFLVSFLLIRQLLKLIASPFGRDAAVGKSWTIASASIRLALALIPTAAIWLASAAFLHHRGSISELRDFSEAGGKQESATTSSVSQRIKSAIESTVPASWLGKLDPLARPERLSLAKLIAAQAKNPKAPVIDPATGKPIPRAIIVDDPELQNLAREGNFSSLLRHPALTRALADPKVQELLGELKL